MATPMFGEPLGLDFSGDPYGDYFGDPQALAMSMNNLADMEKAWGEQAAIDAAAAAVANPVAAFARESFAMPTTMAAPSFGSFNAQAIADAATPMTAFTRGFPAAPTASDISASKASKAAAKAVAAALMGSPTFSDNPDISMAEALGAGQFSDASAWGGEDGGDPAKASMRSAAVNALAGPSLGAPTSPTASPALNSFGVFGSGAAFGTPSSALADVDPMTAFTRDVAAPPATAMASLSPSQLSSAYNGFGQFGDEAKYGMSDAQAAIDADPMTAMTRGFPSAAPDMAPATDTAMSAFGSFGGIGTPTADQAEAQRGMPGLSMAAMSGTPAIGIPSTKASAFAPGLESFNDAFQGSVKSVGPKYSKALAAALATPTIANQVAVTKAAELYGKMNGKPSKAVKGLRAQQIADYAMANPALGDALGLSFGQQGTNALGGGGSFGGIGGPAGPSAGPMGGGRAGGPSGISGPSGPGMGPGGGFGGPGGQPSGPPGIGGPSGPGAGHPGGGYGGGGQPSGPTGPTGPTGPSAGSGGSSGNPGAGRTGPVGPTGPGAGPGYSGAGNPGGMSAAMAGAVAGALAGANANRTGPVGPSFGGLGGGWF